MKYFAVLFFIYTFQTAWAVDLPTETDCTSVDFSDRFGPVRNQGNSGDCYAFVAADLIGFNQSLPRGKQVSALDVVVNYWTSKPDPRKMYAGEKDWERFEYNRRLIDISEKAKKAHQTKSLFLNLSETGGEVAGAVSLYNQGEGVCTEDQLPSEKSEAFTDAQNFLASQFTMHIPITPITRFDG